MRSWLVKQANPKAHRVITQPNNNQVKIVILLTFPPPYSLRTIHLFFSWWDFAIIYGRKQQTTKKPDHIWLQPNPSQTLFQYVFIGRWSS